MPPRKRTPASHAAQLTKGLIAKKLAVSELLALKRRAQLAGIPKEVLDVAQDLAREKGGEGRLIPLRKEDQARAEELARIFVDGIRRYLKTLPTGDAAAAMKLAHVRIDDQLAFWLEQKQKRARRAQA